MKINNEELKKIYRSSIKHNIPISRKDCPSFKKMVKFFEKKLSKKQNTKIIDHITNCSYCMQEFEFIQKTFKLKKTLTKGMEKLFPVDKQKSASKRKIKFLLPSFSWTAAIVLSVFIIITSAYLFLKDSEKETFRGDEIFSVKLIKPLGSFKSEESVLFKWKKVKNTDYYTIELFDEALISIWKSKKVDKNFIIFPKEKSNLIIKNKQYFWTVTAYLDNDRVVESNIGKFIIMDKSESF